MSKESWKNLIKKAEKDSEEYFLVVKIINPNGEEQHAIVSQIKETGEGFLISNINYQVRENNFQHNCSGEILVSNENDFVIGSRFFRDGIHKIVPIGLSTDPEYKDIKWSFLIEDEENSIFDYGKIYPAQKTGGKRKNTS